YHGKPHAPVFHRVSELLGTPIDRLLMVGDNRATDIAGAAASGAGSLLLADGIHHERLLRNGTLDETALAAFLAEDGPVPDYVSTRLIW
ncbi:MAG: HAD hydrolase-like protein, partial [bacterium]|nr:HAD hydrolase-like protein [bacterium]